MKSIRKKTSPFIIRGAMSNLPSFDIPRDESMEIRALDAEIKAILAEAQNAVSLRESRRKEIIDKWQRTFEISDILKYDIDIANSKLVPKNAPSIPVQAEEATAVD